MRNDGRLEARQAAGLLRRKAERQRRIGVGAREVALLRASESFALIRIHPARPRAAVLVYHSQYAGHKTLCVCL